MKLKYYEKYDILISAFLIENYKNYFENFNKFIDICFLSAVE